MRAFSRNLSWFIMGMLILAIPQVGWSEETKEKDTSTFDLGEIVVTATKTERQIYSAASSVSIVTGEEIERSHAKNIPDLLGNLEGIQAYDTSGVGTKGRVNMRGFWGGMSTHNLVLMDGIPLNSGKDKLVDWNLIPLDNIERIEVVRGAGSTLYGDNAFAGVINIITKEGGKVPETRLSSSYGSFHTENCSVATGGTKGPVNYFFNASRKSTRGFRDHCDYDDLHFTGKTGFLINDASNVKLSFGCHESQRGPLPWPLTEAEMQADRDQARPGTENDKGENEKMDLAITYDKNIGEISKLTNTIYLWSEESESFYTSGSNGSSTKEYLDNEDTYGLISRYNINPRLFGMENSIVMGIDLERNNFEYEKYSAPYQVRGTLQSDYKTVREKVGLYIQDEIEFKKPLSFSLGVRYDEVDFDFTNHLDNSKSKKRKMSAISPRFGVVYTYEENSSLYAQAARAFRTPGMGHMFTYAKANPDLDPEEVDDYEIGLRHQFGDLLAGRICLYWMELDNEIWFDDATNKYQNYGQTSHKGIEMGLDANIAKGLTTFCNYTYTRAKIESGANNGNYIPHVAKHKAHLGLEYRSDIGPGANIAINCIDSSFLDNENTAKLSSYTTVDTKVFYEKDRYSFFLQVKNLFDEEYCNYGYISGEHKKYNPASGRTWTFGAALKW